MSKITFDGPNKLIIINSGVTDIDVKQDIYLPWKQWVIDGHSMYLPAFRTFGGDPTSYEQNAPTYFYLINDWVIKAENVYVNIHENLYSDNYLNPFIIINSSVLVKNSDIPGINGLNNYLIDINNTLSGITVTLDDIMIDIKYILGLSQHNYRLFNHVYDTDNKLTSVVIKLFNTKFECDNDINSFAQYQMTATYNNGLLNDYKVVKL